MAELLHPTRLWWDNGRGVLRHDGVRIELRHHLEVPGLPAATYIEADWPGGPFELREGCGGRRDMTADEVNAAWRWLAAVAAEARDAAEGDTTLAVVVQPRKESDGTFAAGSDAGSDATTGPGQQPAGRAAEGAVFCGGDRHP